MACGSSAKGGKRRKTKRSTYSTIFLISFCAENARGFAKHPSCGQRTHRLHHGPLSHRHKNQGWRGSRKTTAKPFPRQVSSSGAEAFGLNQPYWRSLIWVKGAKRGKTMMRKPRLSSCLEEFETRRQSWSRIKKLDGDRRGRGHCPLWSSLAHAAHDR